MKIRDIVFSLLVLGIVLVFYPVRIVGNSMFPTLRNGDLALCSRFSTIDRFDVVVVNVDNVKIIKRVIGLPNETIEYKDNKLYINGKQVQDEYNNGYTKDFKYSLKDNEYFCLGDNRENSKDSREYGGFLRKQIVGEKICEITKK